MPATSFHLFLYHLTCECLHSCQNQILITSCGIWATCCFTFFSRHSDITETVFRRPWKVRAGDVIIFNTVTHTFILLFHYKFPLWPFVDVWSPWSSLARQAQTWGKMGRIQIMILKKGHIPEVFLKHSYFILLIGWSLAQLSADKKKVNVLHGLVAYNLQDNSNTNKTNNLTCKCMIKV